MYEHCDRALLVKAKPNATLGAIKNRACGRFSVGAASAFLLVNGRRGDENKSVLQLGLKNGDVIVLRDGHPSVFASEATSEEADSDGCSSDNW